MTGLWLGTGNPIPRRTRAGDNIPWSAIGRTWLEAAGIDSDGLLPLADAGSGQGSADRQVLRAVSNPGAILATSGDRLTGG